MGGPAHPPMRRRRRPGYRSRSRGASSSASPRRSPQESRSCSPPLLPPPPPPPPLLLLFLFSHPRSAWEPRASRLLEAFPSEAKQNGADGGRRAGLAHVRNHDVDEQQAALQHAPDPARAQVHAPAHELRGHPEGLPAHAVAPGQHLRRLRREPPAARRGSGRRGHRGPEEPPVQAGRHLPHHDHHDQHDVHAHLLLGAPAPPVRAGLAPPPGPPPAGAGPGGRPAGAPDAGHLAGRHERLRRVLHGLAHRARRAHVGHQPHAAPPSLAVHEHAPARPGLARVPGGRRRRGAGPPRAGVLRRALQAEADQAGRDPGGRGRRAGQPEDPRRGLPEPEHHLQVRVPDAVAQQHGGAEAHPGGVAGGGGARAAREDGQARDLQRRRQEAETDVDRGPGEALPGGLLRRAAAAVLGEDRGHRGEAGPEEERGPGLVLQPAAEAEAHEVLGHALRPRGAAPLLSG